MKLDIGCGNHKRGDIGVDISWESEADVIADAHYLPFCEASFDQVGTYAVLEHVDNPDKVLAEASRIAKEGADLRILVPVHSRMLPNFLIYFFTLQFKELVGMYQCNRKGEHKWQFSVSSMEKLLKKHGFQVFNVEFSPPDYYGRVNNPFLRMLQGMHRRCPIYRPHLVIDGRKTGDNCEF